MTFDREIKATNTEFIDDGIVKFLDGGFRYCKTEGFIEIGVADLNIRVFKEMRDDLYVSFGYCWETNFLPDKGTYYFTNSFMYCNYYPSITKDYNSLYGCENIKARDGDMLGITVNYDSNSIEFRHNANTLFTTELNINNMPGYFVVGMFAGRIEIY